MRYQALACDYDGTLAHHGRVDEPTLVALERLLASGRRLILVTGRQLDDLRVVFPQLGLFEWVVAENGALLHRPATHEERPLAEPPPQGFLHALRHRHVRPVSVGKVIVATWRPNEKGVLEAIRELGLELQVVFNKGAVMVLPSGVNKASGLLAALDEMQLSPHNLVGIGDAENDHAFLCLCECCVAVDNALPAIKERADLVTRGDHGTGVRELIDEMLADDLRSREPRLTRHHLPFGSNSHGEGVYLRPHGSHVLIAGPSGSGKSTVATALIERLAERHYQFCIIDPEGDHESVEPAVAVGNSRQPPAIEEVLRLLENPHENAIVSLLGLPIGDRPAFFLALLPRLQHLRARFGRPHWLMIDEAHHLLPATWTPGTLAVPQELEGIVSITVHPDQVSTAMLASVGTVIAVGAAPEATIAQYCRAVGMVPPPLPAGEVRAGEVVWWAKETGQPPLRVRVVPSRLERRRHVRKYAEGELGVDRSFYFHGPEGKLNLRAQNLFLFLQLGEGVDEATWMHHLRQGDYSRWFREAIKDELLALEAERVEALAHVSAGESRALIRAVVEQHYTLPAKLGALPDSRR